MLYKVISSVTLVSIGLPDPAWEGGRLPRRLSPRKILGLSCRRPGEQGLEGLLGLTEQQCETGEEVAVVCTQWMAGGLAEVVLCLGWRTVVREITRKANRSCVRRVLDITLKTLHFIQRQ